MGLTFISTTTASDDASVSITSGIDNTYDIHEIHINGLHQGGSDGYAVLQMQFNGSDESGYNEAITSAAFHMYDWETLSESPLLAVADSRSQNNAIGVQQISESFGADSDHSVCGIIRFYGLGGTTHTKKWHSDMTHTGYQQQPFRMIQSGYINQTKAITNIQFSVNAEDMSVGTFRLYGVT